MRVKIDKETVDLINQIIPEKGYINQKIKKIVKKQVSEKLGFKHFIDQIIKENIQIHLEKYDEITDENQRNLKVNNELIKSYILEKKVGK